MKGQGVGAAVVGPADRVQPGQLGGVAHRVAEAAQVADLAGWEAAAQGYQRLPRPALKVPSRTSSSQTLGLGGRVVEAAR